MNISEIIEELEDVVRNQLQQRGVEYVEDETLMAMLETKDFSANVIDTILSAMVAKVSDCTGVYTDTIRQLFNQADLRTYLEDLPISDVLSMTHEVIETVVSVHNTNEDGDMEDDGEEYW